MIRNMYKVSIINKATFYTLPERYINKIVQVFRNHNYLFTSRKSFRNWYVFIHTKRDEAEVGFPELGNFSRPFGSIHLNYS